MSHMLTAIMSFIGGGSLLELLRSQVAPLLHL